MLEVFTFIILGIVFITFLVLCIGAIVLVIKALREKNNF